MNDFATLVSGEQPIGAYETLFELGSGGMGTAFLARTTGPGGFERMVVIKRLHSYLLDRPEVTARFLDEARLAACINHANVVPTLQVGQDVEGYFLVLDYVEGVSVEELTDRAELKGERVPPPIALRIALDALAGLHAAHHARDSSGRPLELLHRDVSPQNVLVGRDGVARLVDFGIAKSAQNKVVTEEGFIMGKLQYLPPEYLRRRPIGPEFDVYSLGVTLWVTLSGSDPWPGADEAQILANAMDPGIPPLSSVVQVAPQIEAIVMQACAEQGRRFSSARAMADQIEAVCRDTGWLASHADVADYVEVLAGKDLERRREIIARRERVPSAEAARAEARTEAIPLVHSKPAVASKRGPVVALAVVLAIGVLAGALALIFREPASEPETATPVERAAPNDVTQTPAPAPSPAATAVVPSATEPRPTAAPPAAAPRKLVSPGPPSVSAPKPVGEPAQAEPAGEGISKKNPYRH